MSSIAAECWWSHFYQPFPFFQILRIQWTTFWRNTVKEIDKTASKDNFRGVVTASHPHEIIVAYLWITRNPSPSATTCEASGGKLASLAPTTPWRSDPRLRPQTTSDGLRGRIWGRGLEPERPRRSDWGRDLEWALARRNDYSSNWLKSRFLQFLASDDLGGQRRPA